MASQPDPVVAMETDKSEPVQNCNDEDDLVASFERFAQQMNGQGFYQTDVGIQQCLGLYGEIVQANLKFHLRPLATNLSQMTQEVRFNLILFDKEKERERGNSIYGRHGHISERGEGKLISV